MKKKAINFLLAGIIIILTGCNKTVTTTKPATVSTEPTTIEITTNSNTDNIEKNEVTTANSTENATSTIKEDTFQLATYSAQQKKQRLEAAKKEIEGLKEEYGKKLFVSYDTTYAVGFPDESWGGVEEDTLTTFNKDNMTITSMHLDEIDLPLFGDIKNLMPTTKKALEQHYAKNEETKNYKVTEFDFEIVKFDTAEGKYNRSLSVIETNDAENRYLVSMTMATDNNAFIVSGYCNTESEIKEIKDILLNKYYIF